MPGWLRSAGSGPLTWMLSNATSTAWIRSNTNEKENKERRRGPNRERDKGETK